MSTIIKLCGVNTLVLTSDVAVEKSVDGSLREVYLAVSDQSISEKVMFHGFCPFVSRPSHSGSIGNIKLPHNILVVRV